MNPKITDILKMFDSEFDIKYHGMVLLGNKETSITFSYDDFIKHNFSQVTFKDGFIINDTINRKFKYEEFMSRFYVKFNSDDITFSYNINGHRSTNYTYDEFIEFLPKFFEVVNNAYNTYISTAKLFKSFANTKEKREVSIDDINL